LTGAVQELLTNAVKHGNADKILISVTADSRYIKISVEDNGKGGVTEETLAFRIENGFGIKKIRSYIEKCGGKFDMKYRNGMCVTMELLISDENAV
jgi:signal transduction histidine kinase